MRVRPCFASFPLCSIALFTVVALAPLLGAQQLPDAPMPSAALSAAMPPVQASRPQPSGPLTLRERFILQTRTSFSPVAFIVPAAEAGITMADPPTNYPHDWSDGAGAYARNYGAELGRHTTAGYTHFAAAAILREDPRYYPCQRSNYAARFFHAMAFTLVDRSDSGRHTLAVSNFVGSAAGGFIGMAWEPSGFNDTTHAYQRSAVELTAFAGHNLIEEFSPELTRIAVKLHMAKAQGALMPDSQAPAVAQPGNPGAPKTPNN